MAPRAELARVALALFAVLGSYGAAACRRGARPDGQTATSGSVDTDVTAEALSPMGPRESAQWVAAAAGDAEEAMRLVDVLG
ncbi:MAG: hypothetical protein M3O36_07655, partial [Myxococcota bacterium]|nr:hypothetical protein [Myxococcota bacterium]